MRSGTPDYRVLGGHKKPVEDCTLRDQGGLGGYCAKCGLMRMSHERGLCPKCGGTATTKIKPQPAGAIVAIGYSRFTSYTVGNEKL